MSVPPPQIKDAGCRCGGDRMRRGELRSGTRLDGDDVSPMQAGLKLRMQELQFGHGWIDKDSKYHVVIRSEYPQNKMQQMAAMLVGVPVHSEMLLHEPGTSSQLCTYTAFMGETFSVSMLTDQLIECDGFVDMGLEVTGDELHALQTYVMRLVHRAVPYNYKDLALAAGMVKSRAVLDVMFPDVEDTSADKVQSVYCSQAIVLALRSCLNKKNHPALCKELEMMNSRAVSPKELQKKLEPFCRLVDKRSLRTDTIRFLYDDSDHIDG